MPLRCGRGWGTSPGSAAGAVRGSRPSRAAWRTGTGCVSMRPTRRWRITRDRLFTERLDEETRRLGLHAIEVGTTMTEDRLAGRVASAFGL